MKRMNWLKKKKMKFKVKVIANSSKKDIERISDSEFKVHLKEKAIKGKANKALIEILSEYFRKKKNQISVVSGPASNIKVVEVI